MPTFSRWSTEAKRPRPKVSKKKVLIVRGEYRSREEAERMVSGRDAIHLVSGLVVTAIFLAMIVVGIAVAQ
jgi:hypothetical protein